MSLVPSFLALLQPLSCAMTAPSFESFVTLFTGWVYARRRTVTGLITAADAVGQKHHGSFHRLFAKARWSRDALGLVVFGLIAPWLDDTVMLALDDTLARKRGRKVFGAGMHHDPKLSSRKQAVVNYGHSWVVLAVLIRLPFCTRRTFALPILLRLYLNHQSALKHRRVHRTRPELAVALLNVLCKAYPGRRFHAVADATYGGHSVLNHLPVNCALTSRLALDARLHAAPPPRSEGAPGRPRRRGARLPTPQAMLNGRCRHITLAIYGRRDRVRLADTGAHVYAAPKRPLRVVAVAPLTGGRLLQAFYSTCKQATAEEVLIWYAMRWAIEVSFHDAKQHLGFEQPQGWSRQAAERTAPTAMLLYSLIVLWFAQVGHRLYRPVSTPWYRHKPHASFADMLATLRTESLREQISQTPFHARGQQKLVNTLIHSYQQAA
jgi:SRSO17 transposase